MWKCKISAIILLLGVNLLYAEDDAQNLLPNDCGLCYNNNRLPGGLYTERWEYPWMSILLYQTPLDDIKVGCIGILINNRYVLTPASCVKRVGRFADWKLTSVVIGSYNIFRTAHNCTSLDTSEHCLGRKVTGVEETIVHENYNPYVIDKHYDIALIRLTQNVTFSHFVQPVCLPNNSTPSKRTLFIDTVWGLKDDGLDLPNELLHFVTDTPSVVKKIEEMKITHENQTYAGYKSDEICKIDAGMPLVYSEVVKGSRYDKCTVYGLSWKSRKCNEAQEDGDIMNVAWINDLKPWIISKLRR